MLKARPRTHLEAETWRQREICDPKWLRGLFAFSGNDLEANHCRAAHTFHVLTALRLLWGHVHKEYIPVITGLSSLPENKESSLVNII